MVPLVLADNGRFDPHKFGESLGIPEVVRRAVFTDPIKKEVESASQEAHREVSSKATRKEGGSSEEARHQEDEHCQEG